MGNNESKLIAEKEVMSILGISSRRPSGTIPTDMGFPKPVKTHPKTYLREVFNHWLQNGGVNQKSS
ncbi:AlpA family transcriptional regulator [Phytobacter diazotrophicus]|uniref:AlpA family transcriptional regulator n=1 Tax=Phytobacter diazotrophicus TaxID=395631 RepID=UPI000D1647D5|nr:AlpA family transcriptional regulator [Kluyvera sp. Nf5]